MTASRLKGRVQHLLALADIQLNGNRPWDIQVYTEAFYPRVLSHGSLGLGESFVEGWWDVAALDGFLFRLLDAHLERRVKTFDDRWAAAKARLINLQKPRRAFQVGAHHYDIGNDLYEAMLGHRMVYSCGYWLCAQDLDAAQEDKLDLVCRKLMLEPGVRVLDIGCGWGETLKFAAERYGISGVGVTVSEEQARFARKLCRGLPVQIHLQDYRDINMQFDRILSLGMFEHVGVKNYRRYFEKVKSCLTSDGLFVLHTIGKNISANNIDPWIGKYIFPNSMIPSAAQITLRRRRLVRDRRLAQFWCRLRAHTGCLARQRGKRLVNTWLKIR